MMVEKNGRFQPPPTQKKNQIKINLNFFDKLFKDKKYNNKRYI